MDERTGPAPAGRRGLRWDAVPPATGAAVMATGIVSVGFHLAGFDALSVADLWIAGLLWLLLALAFTALLLGDRRGWTARAQTPPALTAVAATTVLGVRLDQLGWTAAAAALLVAAAASWPVLLTSVLRHLGRRLPGAAFLICVATQGLAVLAATLAPHTADWLAWAALPVFALGLVLYGDALVRFDLRQVTAGSGDHWVAGGAMAISALAASKLLASGVWDGGGHTALRVVTLVLLGVALAWYAVLAVAEVLRPRLRYDLRRWSTVFPLGMTAVASLSASAAAGVDWLDPLGRALLWVAAAVWLVVAVGALRRLRRGPDAADARAGGGAAARAVPVRDD
ncbi:tellurite resistance/C4-dicarboxylate transporter family protein [Kitasatospora sp. NPDC001527]|uniref:tellurite resistance/C4-dicarboxylate transporter family protein n=1 Tax=Kitasatospora sp. NPDC001527 TaxID=3154519 RepID=UPI00331674F9